MVIKQFQNGKYNYNYIKYVADTDEDVKKIPVRIDGSVIGCDAYVITTGKTYVLGSGKIWYAATGEKFECNCKDIVPESTVWEPVSSPDDNT